jgi:hypothetical protein
MQTKLLLYTASEAALSKGYNGLGFKFEEKKKTVVGMRKRKPLFGGWCTHLDNSYGESPFPVRNKIRSQHRIGSSVLVITPRS